MKLAHTQPVVREFPIRIDGDLDAVIAHCHGAGINPGYRIPGENCVLVAISERRTRADIDKLAQTLEEALA